MRFNQKIPPHQICCQTFFVKGISIEKATLSKKSECEQTTKNIRPKPKNQF